MTEQELMLIDIRNCRRVDLVVDPKELTPAEKSRYERVRSRRAKGEPLQYVLGHCDFMGIPFSVDARALIPRPETEILVELAIEKIRVLPTGKSLRILDLGTGAGNITVALAKNIPDITLTAVDVDRGALTLARENARANAVEQRIEFCHKDMGAYLRKAAAQGKRFDMIISNPPYIPTPQWMQLPEDVRREPRLAFDGGEDGLSFYRTIIHKSHRVLTPMGTLLLEIGDGQHNDIKMMFKHYPSYRQVTFHKDYVGTDRIVCAQKNGQ